MATTLYLTDDDWNARSLPWYRWYTSSLRAYRSLKCGTSRGAGATNENASFIAGSTKFAFSAGSFDMEWISPPLASSVTISGSITFNMRCYESDMMADAFVNVQVQRIDPFGRVLSTVIMTTNSSEMGTSEGAENFSETPTSTDFEKGDRILIRPHAEGGSGYSADLVYAGTSGGASGDTYVTFTENLSFMSSPSGTVLYPTASAASGTPAPELNPDTESQEITFDSDAEGAAADGWSGYGANYGTPSWVSGDGHDANGCLSIAWTNSSSDQQVVIPIPHKLYGHGIYTLGFWIKNVSGSGQWQYGFGHQSEDNTSSPTVTRRNHYFGQATPDSDWEYKSIVMDPTLDIEAWDGVIWFSSYGAVTQTVYVDDITITRGSAAGYTEKDMWTSRGSGSVTLYDDDCEGPTGYSALQTSFNYHTHWSRPLQSGTLSGMATVNLRAKNNNTSSDRSAGVEIAVTDTNGENAVLWGRGFNGFSSSAEQAQTIEVAGPDITINDGDRIRLRMLAGDGYWSTSPGRTDYRVANGGNGVQVYFAGTSGGAAGDTYVTLPISVSEYTPAGADPFPYIGGGYYG